MSHKIRYIKKGQIMGEIFIYIMSAVIFGMVLIYGYKAIADFIHRADQVAEVELSTELKSAVSTIASSQDVKQKTLTVPAKFRKICFIDLDIGMPGHPSIDLSQSGICSNAHPDYNMIICNFWKSGAENNVFLLPNPSDVKMNVGKIDLGNAGYLCLPISNGKVKLRLEGRGDRTALSAWPEI